MQRGLEQHPKVWHNSELSSCMITIVTDNQQLVANKLTRLALNGSFSLLLYRPNTASLSSSCLQIRVNEGRSQRLGDVAKCALHALLVPSSNLGHVPDIAL